MGGGDELRSSAPRRIVAWRGWGDSRDLFQTFSQRETPLSWLRWAVSWCHARSPPPPGIPPCLFLPRSPPSLRLLTFSLPLSSIPLENSLGSLQVGSVAARRVLSPVPPDGKNRRWERTTQHLFLFLLP